MSEQNKAIIRRLLQGMDAGDLSVLDEVCSADLVAHFMGSDLGFRQTKEAARGFYAAFPDLRHRIEDLVAEGDRVVLRATDEGTHQGEFDGIPATGKRVAFEMMAIYRIAGDKIAEVWEQGDMDGLRRQLGHAAPPDQAPQGNVEIQQVVSRYHQAIADKDLKTTLSCVGPTLYGDAKETAAMRKQIARGFKSPKTAYANKIEFLHTSVTGKPVLALVVTKETGSSTWLNGRTLSWKGAINLWCLAKVRGKWRIIRSMHNISKDAPAR